MRGKQAPTLALAMLFLAVIACGDSTPEAATPVPEQVEEPTPLSQPTGTPLPTDTPSPTETPVPTDTTEPTKTPKPTNTARPTSTPEPTATPIPAPTNRPEPAPTQIPAPAATPVPAPPPTVPPAPAPAQGQGTVYLESHTSDSATCRISVWGGGNDFLLDAGPGNPASRQVPANMYGWEVHFGPGGRTGTTEMDLRAGGTCSFACYDEYVQWGCTR